MIRPAPTRAFALGTVLLGLAANAAGAAELQLGATGQYVYNSNFFNAPNDPDAANSFQIGPNVAIVDTDGRFRYDVTYTGGYQAYVDQDGANAWESRLRARGTYDITRRTSIQVTNRFRDISNLRFSEQDIELANGALDPTRDRYLRDDLEVELSHALTRRIDWRIRAGYHWIDFDKNVDRNDSQSVDVGTEFDYQLFTPHAIGAGISYTYQDFENAFSRIGSQGDLIEGYALWRWDITDRIQWTMQGGPVWVRSEDDPVNSVRQTQFVGGDINGQTNRANFLSCNVVDGIPRASRCDFQTAGAPPIPASDLGGFQSFALTTGDRVGSASDVTFFGGAALSASYAEWNLLLSYTRRQATTSGDATASSLDQAIVNLEYAPPKYRWSTYVAFSFDRRESLTKSTDVDFVVTNGVDGAAQRALAFTEVVQTRTLRDNYVAIAGVRGALTRNWSGTFEFRYRHSEFENRGISQPGTDTFLLLFTVDYTYDPIHIFDDWGEVFGGARR
jgi:hypothetical protein